MERREKAPSLPEFITKFQEHEFVPYLFLFLAIFFQLSLLSFTENALEISNIFGRTGHYFAHGMFYLFGRASYIPGILFFIVSILFFRKQSVDLLQGMVALPLLLFSAAVALHIAEVPTGSVLDSGGVFGSWLSYGIEYVFGYTGKLIITWFVLLYSIASMVSLTDFKATYAFFHTFFRGLSAASSFPVKESMSDETKSQPKKYIPWLEKKTDSISNFDTKNLIHKTNREIDPKESLLPKKNRAPIRTGQSSIYDGFFDDENHVYNFRKTPENIRIKLENTKPEYWKLTLTDRRQRGTQENETNNASHHKTSVILENEREPIPFVFNKSQEDEAQDNDTLQNGIEDDLYHLEEDFVKEAVEYLPIDDVDAESEDVDLPVEIESIELPLPEPRLFPAPTSMVPDLKLAQKNYNLVYGRVFHPVVHQNDANSRIEADKVARKIEDIILQYGYESKVVTIEKGPIITRYELTPPPGIKLGRITSLSDELKLYLAVKSIRIVAPIPGRSTIGIEVPNKIRDDVYLSDILKDKNLTKGGKDLTIPLGKDISGKNIFIDLNKLPHLLIAGTTGSGKSVSLNAMIAATIFTKSPEDVRFIMIDPKMVELTLYEDIPHLLMPVITDPKKAARALQWAIQEMEARYMTVSSMKCRDLKSYNEKIENGNNHKNLKKMPYIVIFIDELADLMMVSGKDLEDSITRISQKSRAVGIHLVMATQRPSVDVITGLIKANCPARVAFHVAQKTDSKIILDHNGAETLLGKGDLLYKSPTHAELLRIQAPYIAEDEIEKIVEECSKYGAPVYVDFDLNAEEPKDEMQEEDEDAFEEAWNIIKVERKASASYIQRRLRIGYNKAARIMEMMEQRGYVGPQIGAKPREILK